MEKTIRFQLNGKPVILTSDPERPLLWILRTDFNLTGTKYGCGEGHCGACTVLVDNRALRSCQLTLGDAAGKNVVTIERLSDNGALHPVQQAFIAHDALQCGFCTPGMILNAVSLLHKNSNPARAEIIEEMEDNLCRCGAHTKIIDAIETAAKDKSRRTVK